LNLCIDEVFLISSRELKLLLN